MKVVFLDIDGVLNTERWIKEQYYKTGKPHNCHWSEFDPICMQNLKELIEETNAKIVISSTWRFGYKDNDDGWKALMERLDSVGIKDRFIGVTPSLSDKYDGCCRGYEIQKWLDDNSYLIIENFVIIDDDSDMFHLLHKLAECSFKDGFTKEVKDRALEIINT